jgi:predicted HTH domain antitoxin
MKTLTINIPDSVNETDVKMQLAVQLFEKGVLSSGQAADLAGISKREFIETVGKYGVTIFGETPDDLKNFMNE